MALRTNPSIRSLTLSLPRPGVDAAAVLAYVRDVRTAAPNAWPLPPASILSVLLAMVGSDREPTLGAVGQCRFGAQVTDVANQLGLSATAVEHTLWGFLTSTKILGVSLEHQGMFELAARYTTQHAIAGCVDWPLVLEQLRPHHNTARNFAQVRMMLDAYAADVTVEALLEPHASPITREALASVLMMHESDVRKGYTGLEVAGIWDSPRSTGRGPQSWRWHPQVFGLAPFTGDLPLVPPDARAKGQPHVLETAPATAASARGSALVANLKALAELYQQGALTTEEFVDAKAQVLG